MDSFFLQGSRPSIFFSIRNQKKLSGLLTLWPDLHLREGYLRFSLLICKIHPLYVNMGGFFWKMQKWFSRHKEKAKLLSWLLGSEAAFFFWPFTSFYVIMGQGIQENMAAPQQYLNERQNLSMAKTFSLTNGSDHPGSMFLDYAICLSLLLWLKCLILNLFLIRAHFFFPGLNKHRRIS